MKSYCSGSLKKTLQSGNKIAAKPAKKEAHPDTRSGKDYATYKGADFKKVGTHKA